MSLKKIILICIVLISGTLQAVSPKPGVNVQLLKQDEVLAQAQGPSVKSRTSRRFAWIAAGLGATVLLNMTQSAWFPAFEKLTASTVTGDLVKKQETLVLEIIRYDSENDVYLTEYEEIDDPILLFVYDKFGLEGVLARIISELGDQGVDLEISSIDEEFEYELVVKVEGESTPRTYQTSEEIFEDAKKGKDYRFKVSLFDVGKVVDLIRLK